MNASDVTGTSKISLGVDPDGNIVLGLDAKGKVLFWDPNLSTGRHGLSLCSLTARAKVLQAIASGAEVTVVDMETISPRYAGGLPRIQQAGSALERA